MDGISSSLTYNETDTTVKGHVQPDFWMFAFIKLDQFH